MLPRSIRAAAIERVGRFTENPCFVGGGKKIQAFFDNAKANCLSALRILRESATPQHALGAEGLVDSLYMGMDILVGPGLGGDPIDPRCLDVEVGVFGRLQEQSKIAVQSLGENGLAEVIDDYLDLGKALQHRLQ